MKSIWSRILNSFYEFSHQFFGGWWRTSMQHHIRKIKVRCVRARADCCLLSPLHFLFCRAVGLICIDTGPHWVSLRDLASLQYSRPASCMTALPCAQPHRHHHHHFPDSSSPMVNRGPGVLSSGRSSLCGALFIIFTIMLVCELPFFASSWIQMCPNERERPHVCVSARDYSPARPPPAEWKFNSANIWLIVVISHSDVCLAAVRADAHLFLSSAFSTGLQLHRTNDSERRKVANRRFYLSLSHSARFFSSTHLHGWLAAVYVANFLVVILTVCTAWYKSD